MRSTGIVFSILLLSFSIARAQHHKLAVFSSVQVGVLEGEESSSFQLQTVNGIKYKTWATGIGVGLDYYHARTIPVFLDIRKTIFGRAKSPFVYASAGYNFPWKKTVNEVTYGEARTTGGLYYDAGIGYQLPVLKNSSLFFTAGYSFKHYKEMVNQYVYCAGGLCPPYEQTFDYQLRRLSIRAGLRF